MNTKQLVLVVAHAARTYPVYGQVGEELYDDIAQSLNIRPTHLTWGAHCLYIDLPNEVRMSVPYKT